MPTPTLRGLARFQWSRNLRESSRSLNGNIHTTASLDIKDSLKDRKKMNTEPAEYSKSGSDAEAAHKNTAFKPGESTPQDETGSEEKTQGDPLNVSPENHDISKPANPDQGAERSAQEGTGQQKSSGSASPAKGKIIT